MKPEEIRKKEQAAKAYVNQVYESIGADSVRIFITYVGPDGNSYGYSFGVGSYYAQIGQVKEWVVEQDAKTNRAGWESCWQDDSDDDEDDTFEVSFEPDPDLLK